MHRIRGPSPKEQGIPGACDGGAIAPESQEIPFVDLVDDTTDFTEGTPGENTPVHGDQPSFMAQLLSDDEMEPQQPEEDRKLDLMNQMIELKRMELEFLREKHRGSSS
ncbi:hypothetical protein R1sor_002088 [Riccia sorocarpa]|uniref:Uncharacterized protein n=1 Tax=Riccia sorocarpa TaxID=122646 RepID=A0ABD3GZF4_9MARC